MKARTLLCCFVLSLTCVVVSRTSCAQAANDNPSVTNQMNDAKTTAAKIKKDAVQMESFTRAPNRNRPRG